MEPRNPLLQLPPKFLRTPVESSRLVQSVCTSCTSTIASSASPDALDIAEKLHKCSVDNGTAVRVLVVDDDKLLAYVISEVLHDAGFEVSTFNHALHAAQFALKSPPDVVVTDFVMPDIDGLVFTAWLSVNYPACKVVIVSGDAATVAEQAPLGLKFALLQKPVPTEVLIAAVQSGCGGL
jgi:CheY-like chemotaxis protein